jgi:beta-galactosidase/beta-glucuronidase
MSNPRSEYPRPQFVRPDWLCLNGPWQFEIDASDSGLERGLLNRELANKITVPFCPESVLSGIGNTDFMPVVWYRRDIQIPAEWTGRRILLHFQAVDYDATVWASGNEVARHRGGFTPFIADLGQRSANESVVIVLRARDPRTGSQPRGKQSEAYANAGCHYTRTTGIWQTVWLEPVPETYLKRPRITPNFAAGSIQLQQPIAGNTAGLRLRATLSDASGTIATATTPADADFAPSLDLAIPKDRRRPWSIRDPHLYDIQIELLGTDGQIVDAAKTYAGLRAVTLQNKAVKLNGETIFQRLVLDQGYYPDGILTAPTDQALIDDIRLSIEAGFNGARLHQKVFEERFLYHCDRLGYIVWGEFPDWGGGGYGPANDLQQPTASFITEWLEAIERDYSHPSIIGWCPLNETHQQIHDRITQLDDVTRGMFLATKAMDPTRPVLDASGYSHRVPESDIYDSHDYEQNPEKLKSNQAGLADGKPFINLNGSKQTISLPYLGQPYFVSEFGGIWWNPDVKPGEYSWGYGDRPRTIEEFYTRFEGLCGVLLDDPNMFGYCYTQLTDVFQEQNGLYHFNRRPKFDMTKIRAIQQRKAAIEAEK